MARSFHEAYGVRSLALATFPLAPTRHSRIVDVEHPRRPRPRRDLRRHAPRPRAGPRRPVRPPGPRPLRRPLRRARLALPARARRALRRRRAGPRPRAAGRRTRPRSTSSAPQHGIDHPRTRGPHGGRRRGAGPDRAARSDFAVQSSRRPMRSPTSTSSSPAGRRPSCWPRSRSFGRLSRASTGPATATRSSSRSSSRARTRQMRVLNTYSDAARARSG